MRVNESRVVPPRCPPRRLFAGAAAPKAAVIEPSPFAQVLQGLGQQVTSGETTMRRAITARGRSRSRRTHCLAGERLPIQRGHRSRLAARRPRHERGEDRNPRSRPMTTVIATTKPAAAPTAGPPAPMPGGGGARPRIDFRSLSREGALSASSRPRRGRWRP